MRRVVRAEFLDSDDGTPQEIAAALADLRRVNRWFGGVRTTRALLETVAWRTRRQEFSALDVACGSGDSCLQAAEELSERDIWIRVMLLDRAASHLPRNGARRLVGHALRLPFADNSFDVVSCALFVHHLEPAQVVEFVNEALRVARVAVAINDLRRSARHLALVAAGRPLFRSRMAWQDGLTSVRRAYTTEEIAELLHRTAAVRVQVTPSYLFRFAALAWKGTEVRETPAGAPAVRRQ